MFFHFRIFLYSIFFLGIELLLVDFMGSDGSPLATGSFWLKLLAFAVLSIYFIQVAKKFSWSTKATAMPLLFVLSSLGLLYFVEPGTQQHVLAVLVALGYYFIHLALYRLRAYRKDQTALGIAAAGSVATIFLFYAASYGLYLNFAIPLWILMGILIVVTTLISFQYFWLIKQDRKLVLNYSLILGFVMAEIAWVLNFWPFGYLTTGVIALIFYYVLWDLVQCHFRGILSKRRLVANMVFFGLLAALVLASSRWLPVV